jgi:hypothetical protein
MSLFFSLLCFGVASFFKDVFVFEPLVFWSCISFHWISLFLSPFHFGLPLFSLEVFVFEPTSEGFGSTPSVVALSY